MTDPRAARATDLAIWIAVAACAVGIAIVAGYGHVLGYDEAVYAVGGRTLLHGGPDTGWEVFRSAGMRLVAVPGVVLGGSEVALRIVPAMLGIATVIVIARAGRRWVGGPATAVAIATLAAVPYFVRHSAELLSDTPSLGLALAALAIATTELARDDGPRWRLVAAAPLAAAAFYVRYGSIQLLVAIGVVVAIAHRRALARHPARVVATAITFLVLLAPHFILAASATGSPLGILRASAAATTQTYVGDGVIYYLRTWPYLLFGIPGGIVTAIGLVAGARWAVRRAPADRTAVLLWSIAVIHTIWVGLSAHGERRYMFPALVLLALVGSRALVLFWQSRPRPRLARRVAMLALAAAIAVSLVQAVLIVRTSDRYSRILTAVAARIRTDAAGASCGILGSATAHNTWYAGCISIPVGADPIASLATLHTSRKYIVLLATAPRREPPPALKDQIRAMFGARLLATIPDASTRHNDAELYLAP